MRAGHAIRWCCSSADLSGCLSACAPQYQAVLTTLVYRRKLFIPVFLGLCVAAGALIPVLGRGLFSEQRYRAIQAACAGEDRYAY